MLAHAMATLQRIRDGRTFPLPSQVVVGRAQTCQLSLSVSSVSAHHAEIRWDGRRWLVHDLGSRNGTYLNGQPVARTASLARPLALGDVLSFAERAEVWRVVDTAAPAPMLVPSDGSEAIVLTPGKLLAWPSEERPLALVYEHAGQWKLDDSHGVQDLSPGAPFQLGSVSYRLSLPAPELPTSQAEQAVSELRIETTRLEICVAHNEETASVVAYAADERLCLPARAHLYLLAFLARRRLADAATPTDAPAQHGWITAPEACDALALDAAETLSVMVHRCRKDFERLGFYQPASVIDRARRGQLRIGWPPERVQVTRAAD